MSKTKEFIVMSLGFMIFLVCFIRLGFLLNYSISNTTLPYSLAVYVFLILVLSIILDNTSLVSRIYVLGGFLFYCILLYGVALGLSSTFDTSWDGQGYNQTAVIALANRWNPVFQPDIELQQRLPSQIFAESYPSAIWEIQASVYSLTGTIQSAKVTSVALGILAGIMMYILALQVTSKKHIAFVVSLIVVLQPIYVLQLLTFMQDGLVFQLLIIAITSLAIVALSLEDQWAISVFIMATLLLVGSKYSNLPVVLILGTIFFLLLINRYLNRVYNKSKLFYTIFFLGLVSIMSIFLSIPYIRNMRYHGTPFYPTNIPELIGSVTYNNVPSNLKGHSKLELLFYGIFSKSQSIASGDPRSPENIAVLKIPFSFSASEIKNSAFLYNNRVGAGGPLYSGIVLLGFLVILVAAFGTTTRSERYVIYTSLFMVIAILFSALLLPTPNLMRYATQLQLIPFAVYVPIYTMSKKKHVNVLLHALIFITFLNTALFAFESIHQQWLAHQEINKQVHFMRLSDKKYQVSAQHFYSNYVLLQEQQVPFTAVGTLTCSNRDYIKYSSLTTQFCED